MAPQIEVNLLTYDARGARHTKPEPKPRKLNQQT